MWFSIFLGCMNILCAILCGIVSIKETRKGEDVIAILFAFLCAQAIGVAALVLCPERDYTIENTSCDGTPRGRMVECTISQGELTSVPDSTFVVDTLNVE